MTSEEARKAIQNHSIVSRIGEIDTTNKWYYITCLSDDETYAYLKLRGCLRTGANLSEIQPDPFSNRARE